MDVLHKFSRMMQIIRFNDGFRSALYTLYRTDTLKMGKYVGKDEAGNKYYESDYYMLGRSRWVDYPEQYSVSYEASMVSPEWFGWLHYKTDLKPCEDCAKQALYCCPEVRAWLLPPQENLTGTVGAYYPYSTVKQHIDSWDGLSVGSRIRQK